MNKILGRGTYKKKLRENSKQLRVRSITEAQLEKHILTFIRSDTTYAEWDQIKKDKVYETELGYIALVAVSRAIHMDILIFNANADISILPIEIVCAEKFEGGFRNNINPIIMAYNGIHSESLKTISPEDDKKAIELVNLNKIDGYKLNKNHIPQMTRRIRKKS